MSLDGIFKYVILKFSTSTSINTSNNLRSEIINHYVVTATENAADDNSRPITASECATGARKQVAGNSAGGERAEVDRYRCVPERSPSLEGQSEYSGI